MRFLVLLFLVVASAVHGRRQPVHQAEWERYQCDLPLEERDNKVPCFCMFLQDRVPAPEDMDSSLSALSKRNGNTMRGPTQIAAQSSSKQRCIGGQVGGYPCNAIDLQSFVPVSTFGHPTFEVNDLWGWTDPNSKREFAILGLNDGTAFIDITTPSQPRYLGKMKGGQSSFRDVKVYANHALVVSESENDHTGLQVFDLTRLLTASGTGAFFTPDAVYNEFVIAHNIAVNEDTGFAYVLGSDTCNAGLHMIDVSNPKKPRFVGCYSDDGYTHDAHCVVYAGPHDMYKGHEMCFCANEDTVTIVDVTDKDSPTRVSSTKYSDRGYTHQGWLSEDHKYFIFGDEADESYEGFNTRTLVMDVQNLMSPFLAGQHFGATKATDHNLYVLGTDLIFVANYRAGLRVLRINDLSNAKFEEVGYFDVFPYSDAPRTNGAWSVYPYFASGNVIVSGIEQGLFVLTPDFPLAPEEVGAGGPPGEDGAEDPPPEFESEPDPPQCKERNQKCESDDECCSGNCRVRGNKCAWSGVRGGTW